MRRTAILLLLTALAGCGPPQPEETEADEVRVPAGTPLVLISIDTLRSDRLPAYGYDGVETPAIERLRADGILFERAYAHTPLTLPSHASILTGLLPHQHGVRDNMGYKLPEGIEPYLPRALAAAGYRTGAAVSAFAVHSNRGFAQGFDFYEDSIDLEPERGIGEVQRPGDETLRLSLDWLREASGRPFFFFFHIYEPHTPYEPPAPFAGRYPSPYDGEVAAADRIVGDLLDELRRLGVYDRAIIVLLSDHGEGLGDHGGEEHGVLLYRESLQVPLILKLPGGRLAGTRVAAPCQLIDLYPTLAALLDLPLPDGLEGRSLLEPLDEPPATRYVYSETFYPRIHFGWSELASLIDDRHHYIEGPDPELYDLVQDPGETRNILDQEPRAVATLRRELARFDRTLNPPSEVDAETREALAALGYIGVAGGDLSGPLPDPKSRLHSLKDLEDAFRLFREGDDESAVEAFQRTLAENPQMLDAWEYLGLALYRLGRLEESLAAFTEALELSGGDVELALEVAKVHLALGQPEAARGAIDEAARQGVDVSPLRRRLGLVLAELGRPREAIAELEPLVQAGDPEAAAALGLALSEDGLQDEARAVLERLLAAAPGLAKAHEHLGLVHLRAGEWAAARDSSRRAVELDPELVQAWNNLGVALYYLGEREGALGAWERAVGLDPQLFDTLFNLGLKAGEAGRPDLARWALQRFVDGAPADRYGPDLERARALLRQLGG